MKWTRGTRSADVEDRRGQRASGGAPLGGNALKMGGGGAILLALVAVVANALGMNLPFLGGGGASGPAAGGAGGGAALNSGPSSGGGATTGQPPNPATDPDRELVDFCTFVITDIQDTFQKAFANAGQEYPRAKLVIFTEAVDTACGTSSAAIGPFYCPGDNKAYIDLSFYRDLKARFGAPGDFAQAYVLAHEIGHHLQNITGDNEKYRKAGGRDPRKQNEMSVRQELQADCYAGVWAASARDRKLLDVGDYEEAIKAAEAIGDDRLQKSAGAQVNSETWTHGSSAQRMRWFKVGYDSGSLGSCDTFDVRSL